MLPLVRRARGRIVLVTSGMGRVASPVRGIHCAMQAALEAEATCLRQELKPRGVDVIVVAPGEYTSGTSWLTDDHIRNQAREMWEQLCEEQRKAYGEEYFETAVRSLEKYTKAKVIKLLNLDEMMSLISDCIVYPGGLINLSHETFSGVNRQRH